MKNLYVKAIVPGTGPEDSKHIFGVMDLLSKQMYHPPVNFHIYYAGKVQEGQKKFFAMDHKVDLDKLPIIQFIYKVAQGQGKLITQIEGAHTYQTYQELLNEIHFSELGPDGEFRTSDGRKLNRGFIPGPEWVPSLLSIDLPGFAWLAIGAFGAYKASTSKKTTGQVVWSGLAVYSGLQYNK